MTLHISDRFVEEKSKEKEKCDEIKSAKKNRVGFVIDQKKEDQQA